MKKNITITALLIALGMMSAQAQPALQKSLIPIVLGMHNMKMSNSQLMDAKDIKSKLSRDSARHLCIAYPGNTLCFTISHPLSFLKSRPNDQSRVVIYIGGMELHGFCTSWQSAVTGIMVAAGKTPLNDSTNADIYIRLVRDDSTQQAWDFLYSNKPGLLDNHVSLGASIGWEGMSALEKGPLLPELNVVFYYNWILISWMGLFLLILAGFGWLSFKTNALRESNIGSAYSLSVTQLMFWTTLVIAAFIYTLILTDMPSAFNFSILLMLGVSLTTTGAATLIDTRFKQNNQNIQKPHKSFLSDLLTSDGNSYSVQRIQVFAWNIVLGLYFIIYTVINKTMPVFSSTLLFLAGISSISYVGTKMPENDMMKQNQQS
ncbi:MAG: hypothetical protein ACHQF4_00995 [Sphingobacteriales bacterium]